jgi:Flp pilus assembly protein TadD
MREVPKMDGKVTDLYPLSLLPWYTRNAQTLGEEYALRPASTAWAAAQSRVHLRGEPMQRIFELPNGTYEAIQAQAQGDYLRALRLLRGLADDHYPASYDVLAYILQAVGRFADAEQAVRRSYLLQQRTAQPLFT